MKRSFNSNYKMIIDYIFKTIVITTAFVSIIMTMFIIIETINSKYSMDGIIIEVNSNEILVEDITGNIWAFSGKDYRVDDVVRILFFNNYTDNTRLDDEIIKVTKLQQIKQSKAK